MWPGRNAWVCVLRVCLLILLLLIQGDPPQAGGLETRPSLGSLPPSLPHPIPAHQLELTTVRTALMCVPCTPLRRAPHAGSDVNGSPERLGRICITEYSRCGQILQRGGKPTCAWWGPLPLLAGAGQKLVLQARSTGGFCRSRQREEGRPCWTQWTERVCTPPPQVTVHCRGEQEAVRTGLS